MSAKKARPVDKAAQLKAAKELQRQIDEMLSGQATERPRSLRDFIDKKMAEDARRKMKKTVTKRAQSCTR
jgi:hypothetical protein